MCEKAIARHALNLAKEAIWTSYESLSSKIIYFRLAVLRIFVPFFPHTEGYVSTLHLAVG